MAKWWFAIGSLAGFLGVAGGAFGAHMLQARLSPQQLAIFDTGTRYLLVHALALVLVGVLARGNGAGALIVAGVAFSVGMLIFTGSLWVLSITGIKWLGAITPLGGLALLAGWTALGLAALRGQLS
jgi:uncharacterized membrane protein YgdD (TMEM256/DUF423 family)